MNNGTVFWGDFKRNKAFDGACKLTALSHDVLLSHCTVFQDVYYILSQLKFQRRQKKKKKSMFFRKTLQRGTFWVPALKVPYKFCYTDFLNSVKGKRPPSKCTGDSHRHK